MQGEQGGAQPIGGSMIDTETERRMTNWARWRVAGGRISLAMSSAYSLEGRGRRDEVGVPLIDGEAEDVEKVVLALQYPLQLVLIEYWVKGGSVAQKARACRCARSTFFERLALGHKAVVDGLAQLRRQSEHRRTRLAPAEPLSNCLVSSGRKL